MIWTFFTFYTGTDNQYGTPVNFKKSHFISSSYKIGQYASKNLNITKRGHGVSSTARESLEVGKCAILFVT